MRLFAAIIPPRDLVEELREAVLAVDAPRPGGHKAKRGLLGRLGTREPEPATPSSSVELEIPDLDAMYLPITGFGNVTLGDSVQLANALRQEAAGWQRPTLHFAGGAALEFPKDESVWAKLDGDLDALNVIGRGVPQIVQRLGFFVDRRQFRPWLSVGTITDHTTAPYLERVVERLESYDGRPWTVESVSLMKRVTEGGIDSIELMEELPLAR
jgi:RNA 2',3'-cyclic 3'-phosphodiesterase